MIPNFKADEEMDTPYKRARQVWDNRIGTTQANAYYWRMIAFSLLGIIVVLSAGLIYLGSLSKIVPYVVEVRDNGQISTINPATENTYVPSRECN